MFERYTEDARRVVFFARYEASAFGTLSIETEHLLLGLLREDKELAERLQALEGGLEGVRKRIGAATPERAKTPTSVDMPLSPASKRVLVNAGAAADGMGQREIETGHLALGLLREERSLAAQILREGGLG